MTVARRACYPDGVDVLRIVRLVLLAPALLASSGEGRPAGKLLRVGVFLEDYLRESAPGPWQALCPGKDGLALRTTTVRITPAPPLHGDEPAKNVDALECPDALVLMRVGSLRDGQVETVFRGEPRFLSTGETTLRVGKSRYELEERRDGERLAIVLRLDAVEQRVVSLDSCCNDASPMLLWAGDVDRDQKLDLVLDLKTHYAASRYALFLSSAARSGDLVAEVAHFVSGSC